jgi:hypothetical protein
VPGCCAGSFGEAGQAAPQVGVGEGRRGVDGAGQEPLSERAERHQGDAELGLQLGDPLLRRRQLGVLFRRAARLQAAVDPVLSGKL